MLGGSFDVRPPGGPDRIRARPHATAPHATPTAAPQPGCTEPTTNRIRSDRFWSGRVGSDWIDQIGVDPFGFDLEIDSAITNFEINLEVNLEIDSAIISINLNEVAIVPPTLNQPTPVRSPSPYQARSAQPVALEVAGDYPSNRLPSNFGAAPQSDPIRSNLTFQSDPTDRPTTQESAFQGVMSAEVGSEPVGSDRIGSELGVGLSRIGLDRIGATDRGATLPPAILGVFGSSSTSSALHRTLQVQLTQDHGDSRAAASQLTEPSPPSCLDPEYGAKTRATQAIFALPREAGTSPSFCSLDPASRRATQPEDSHAPVPKVESPRPVALPLCRLLQSLALLQTEVPAAYGFWTRYFGDSTIVTRPLFRDALPNSGRPDDIRIDTGRKDGITTHMFRSWVLEEGPDATMFSSVQSLFRPRSGPLADECGSPPDSGAIGDKDESSESGAPNYITLTLHKSALRFISDPSSWAMRVGAKQVSERPYSAIDTKLRIETLQLLRTENPNAYQLWTVNLGARERTAAIFPATLIRIDPNLVLSVPPHVSPMWF
ncbi:hypothetical protein BDK51DRAFT_36492 [Blyttiomyces helicus]|uniref:Uncharacterized protein n=1 Tax=Blyttiomyces helicus TaxID=388810 RepID=A0A4P9WE45_9FUNG|nr:hypothetical protein BDK51DRAFT_36492 [Blyttiomyces helicus]|eukprot:RKO90652.1 hypothetical protein BDK51DRAFT_36492 [Blyttiomyces helicus]